MTVGIEISFVKIINTVDSIGFDSNRIKRDVDTRKTTVIPIKSGKNGCWRGGVGGRGRVHFCKTERLVFLYSFV